MKLFILLINHYAMKICMERGSIDPPHILNLGTTWRWAVSFKFRPYFFVEKNLLLQWMGAA